MILTPNGLSDTIVRAEFYFDDDHLIILQGAALALWRQTQQNLLSVYIASLRAQASVNAAPAPPASEQAEEEDDEIGGLTDLLDV